jgi:hypothetical protein
VAAKYEYYDAGDDWRRLFGGALTGSAQTFTLSASHKITKVVLKLYRVGSPGTISVSIQGVDGNGKPDGTSVSTGTLDGDTLTTNSDGTWYDVTMSSALLVTGTQYAIVAFALSGDDDNRVGWRTDSSAASYSGGSYYSTTDGGTTWDIVATSDYMFEEWGNPFNPPVATGLNNMLTVRRLVAAARNKFFYEDV